MILDNKQANELIKLAFLAGKEILKIYKTPFIKKIKRDNSPVTKADIVSNEIICSGLKKLFPDIPIIKTKSNIAEFVKYFTNTFLATKVAFANEMKKICDELQIDYDKVVEYSIYDKRLGNSHWAVPGPDGKNGFGGSCFPKDINALIHLFRQLNLKSNILEASWKTNLEVRPEKDWENLKGRAVTE